MAKKIFILITVEVAADGSINYDMAKFEDIDTARAYGRKLLDEWMAENEMIDDCKAEDYYEGKTCRVKSYGSNLVEAIDNMSIAEFDFCIKEFEV